MSRTLITSGLNSVTGSYQGNGVDGRIIECGFSPDILIIKGDTAQYAVFKTSVMSGDKTAYIGNNASNFADGIQTFETLGFSLGTNATVNSSGVTYYYHALKASSGVDINVGSYVGNNTDNRNITGIGFTPDFVFVKRDGATSGYFRDSSDVGDISHTPSSAAADTSNFIQSFTTDGFQVGNETSVNLTGQTYYYFAIKSDTNLFKIGTFTGNGADNRGITGVGFQPDVVWIKTTSQIVRWRTNFMIGDLAIGLMNGTSANNKIQSLQADGFQVGSDASVNNNGNDIHYIAFKNHRSRVIA